jgi:hypothetical protein
MLKVVSSQTFKAGSNEIYFLFTQCFVALFSRLFSRSTRQKLRLVAESCKRDSAELSTDWQVASGQLRKLRDRL